MSTADYSRAWGNSAPTALGVDLRPGANARSSAPGDRAHAGTDQRPRSVDRRTPRSEDRRAASEGLGQLGEISTLLLLAAILAMAAALTSASGSAAPRWRALRLSGAKPHRLRRILLVEAALMLGAGCVTGALAGIYGQVVIDGYLATRHRLPGRELAAGWRPLEIFVLVIVVVLAIVAVPGWLASRVPPALALEEE